MCDGVLLHGALTKASETIRQDHLLQLASLQQHHQRAAAGLHQDLNQANAQVQANARMHTSKLSELRFSHLRELTSLKRELELSRDRARSSIPPAEVEAFMAKKRKLFKSLRYHKKS